MENRQAYYILLYAHMHNTCIHSTRVHNTHRQTDRQTDRYRETDRIVVQLQIIISSLIVRLVTENNKSCCRRLLNEIKLSAMTS